MRRGEGCNLSKFLFLSLVIVPIKEPDTVASIAEPLAALGGNVEVLLLGLMTLASAKWTLCAIALRGLRSALDRFKNKVLPTHGSIDLALSLVEFFAQTPPPKLADLVHDPITRVGVGVVCVNIVHTPSVPRVQKLKSVAVVSSFRLFVTLSAVPCVGIGFYGSFFERRDVSEINKSVELIYVLVVLVESCTYSCDVSVAMTVDGSDAGVAVDNCDEAAG